MANTTCFILLIAAMLTGCSNAVIPDTFTLRGGTTVYHDPETRQANFVNGEATWKLKK